MLAITLCEFAWYGQNFFIEVYINPFKLSRFTKTHAAKKEKGHKVACYRVFEFAYCAILLFELVVRNNALARMNAVPGAIER